MPQHRVTQTMMQKPIRPLLNKESFEENWSECL